MNFVHTIGLIASKDLRLEFRSWRSLAAMLALSIAIIFAFAFTLGSRLMAATDPKNLVPAVLWVTLVFAALVGFQNSFALERERDALSGLLLGPADHSAIYLGKLIANFISVVVLEIAIVPLAAVFFGVDLFGVAGNLAVVMLLHTFGLCAVGTFLGVLVSRLRRGEALLAILLLPLVIPILISAGKTTLAVLAGRPLSEVSYWLVLASSFSAILTSISVLVFEYLVEE